MRTMVLIVFILTALQLGIMGIRFEVFFILISRTLVLLKLLGLDIKLGWVVGFEITALSVYLLYAFVFKLDIIWVNVITMALTSLLLIIVQLWDSYNYIYVEEDYFGEEE